MELIKCLRCPACQSSLEFSKKGLFCPKCKREFPIVDDIVILLSQKQLIEFFKREEIKKYFSSEKKVERILNSKNFVDGLEEVAEFVSSDEFQRKYERKIYQKSLSWKEYVKKSIKLLAERAHIEHANLILDWPTGKGHFIRHVLNKIKPTAQIACLDIDFVELASLKAFLERKNKAKNILFVNSDARQLPFADKTFDAVTAWGGFIEVPNAPKSVKESYRVLKSRGWFAGSGEIYKQNSKSMKLAHKMNIDYLATKEKIKQCLRESGFRNVFFETLFEGEDQTTPKPGQAPLPAYGDWYGFVVAGGEK